jgi:ketosteroid isomerase-like protein
MKSDRTGSYSVRMDAAEIDQLIHENEESFNRRDPEVMIASWDARCEWHPFLTAEVEGAQGYRGHDGLRQWFKDIDEMFSEISWHPDSVKNLEGDRVLVLGTIRGRGRTSGVEVETPIGQLIELRDGMILRGWAYPSHEQAMLAAGLKA